MRILHTSDWHLGRLLHERSLIDDQRHALAQILDIARQGSYDALIIAGDVYDRSIPSVEGMQLLSWFLAELRSFSSVPVLMIPGNHDSAARLSFCADVMAVSGIHIQADSACAHIPLVLENEGGPVRVFMVPFLDPHTVNDEEKDSPLTKKTHETAVETVLRRIDLKKPSQGLSIFVGHLFTTGGTTSDSERAFIGAAGLVNPGLFSGFNFTALGHLHRPQQAGERAWYSGSLGKYSFSEAKDRKQVLSVEVAPESCAVEPVALSPLRDMARVKGRIHELLTSSKFNGLEECFLEAELTDTGLVINPLTMLKARYPHVLSVRQTLPQAGFSERKLDYIKTERTLTDDFISFKEYLYDKKPGDDELRLFQLLCSERERA